MPTYFSPRPHRFGFLTFSVTCLFFCALLAGYALALAQSAPQAVAIAVGGDNLTHLLWNNPDGSIALWRMSADGSEAAQFPFGPYTGWAAATFAVGADNAPRILYNHTADGQMSLWRADPATAAFTQNSYGPYPGWAATALAVGGNSAPRILWNHTSDGQISLWNTSPTTSTFSQNSYGPYPGWAAKAVAAGPDNAPRLLWNHTADAQMSLWRVDPTTSAFTQNSYGPYPGYAAIALAVDSSNAPRVLWTGPSSTISLWSVAPNGALTYQNYPDPAGYLPVGMACGTGGDVRLLWSDGQGNAQVWTIAADGTYTSATYSTTPSLTAAATGANKVTLYWSGTIGASSYNVSRSTVSGGPYTQIASNVTTADTGPGMVNAFMYSDAAGLAPGTEYFYVISAVYSGTAGPQSNEASASPDPNAVPWDTGNASQIVSQISTSIASALEPDIDPDTGDEYPATVGILTASGPNGVLYQGNYTDGSPATAYPSSAYYDSNSGTIIYGDGTAASAPAEGDANADAPPANSTPGTSSNSLTPNFQISDLYNYAGNNTGIWRKILSVPGFWGASGTCGLPNLNDPNSVVLAVHSFPPGMVDNKGKPLTIPYSDSGDIYFGGNVNYTRSAPPGKDGKPNPYPSYELDLGLQASAHLANTSVPGWVPVINPVGSPTSATGSTRPTAVSGVTLSNLNGNIAGRKIYAINETRMQFITPNFANIADQTVAMHLAPPFGGVAGGKILVAPFVQTSNGLGLGTPVSYDAATLVYFAQGWRKSAKNGAGGNNLFAIKRTNSIAQTLFDAKHPSYPSANGPSESNVKSFLLDSSAIRGAYWGNNGDSRGVELNSNGSWIPWTDDSSQSLHSGAYPNSKIGGYGYVTWVKQNGFTWETNINLKANHTLP